MVPVMHISNQLQRLKEYQELFKCDKLVHKSDNVKWANDYYYARPAHKRDKAIFNEFNINQPAQVKEQNKQEYVDRF